MIDCSFGPGFLHYADHGELDDGTARIWIPLTIAGAQTLTTFAILDTAADWSIVQWDIAQALGFPIGSGVRVTYSTRLGGTLDGELIRHPVQLRSESSEGESSSLDIDATVWVSKDWRGPCFIGYNGFLERIRFAVDPVEKVLLFSACT